MHNKADRNTLSRRHALAQALVGCAMLLGLGLAPFAGAVAACGPIPGTFPISTGLELDVKNGVTMNGNPVPNGKTGANSVLQDDGTRSTVAQTLPDIVPSFPGNNSTTNASDADSPFVASSAVFFDKITVNNSQTATFSGGGPFHIKTLDVKNGGTVNLAAGTYFINDLKLGDNATINITSEPVILHIGKNLDADKSKDVTINPGGSVAGLQVMLQNNASFKADDRLDFTGLIYGPAAKDVKIRKDSTIHGAIVTGGKVKIEDNTTVTYTPADQAAVSGESTCEPPGASSCGLIPGTFPVSTGSQLDVKNNVTMNGGAVPNGKTGANSVLQSDGTRNTVGQSLPNIVPSFPGNNSTTNASDADSPFVASSAVFFDKITVNNSQTATFSGGGPFHIQTLDVKNGGTVNLAAGTYFINDLKLDDNATINVTSEPVILHIGNKLDAKKDVTINPGGSVTGLRVMLHSNASFKADDRLDFTGLIYGPAAKEVKIKKNSTVRGPIITGGKVTIEDNTTMTYTPADQVAVSSVSTCDVLVHYEIFHDGTAITCDPEPVRITAHDATHAVVTGVGGTTITLTTSTGKGDWAADPSAQGTLNNGTVDDGTATYVFAAGDNGVVNLTLKDTNVETVNINVTDGSASEDSTEDPDLSYAETGFIFLADTVKNNIGPQIAGKSSDTGFGAQVLELQAVRTNNDTGACEAALTGPVLVDLGFECKDPAACGASQVSVNGTAIAGNGASPPPPASFTGVNLDFGTALDTTATLVLNYPDAGRIQLHARYDIPLANGNPSGNLMVGASNAFVARPFGFDIDFSDDRQTNGITGVSFAADANGSAFTKAGQSFNTTITAMQWAPGQDAAPLDGVPDSGVSLAGNSPTPRFGQEASPATVDVTHVLAAPATANTGALGGGNGISGFTSGAVTVPLTFDEVGIIDLNALHTDYLGAGFDVSGTVSSVGRFIPARLVVTPNAPVFRNGPDAAWTCPFTYMDQPFSFVPGSEPQFTVVAQNLAGSAVLNYGGDGTAEDFWKFNAASLLPGRSYADNSGNPTRFDPPTTMNGALGTVTLAGAVDFADGQGTLSVSGDLFTYMRDITVPAPAPAPIAPFEADAGMNVPAADLVDADGVCFDNANPSCNVNPPDSHAGLSVTIASIKPVTTPAANIRFGRMGVQNTFGSEIVAQTVPLITQFFDGAGFVTNTDDACTALQLMPHIDLGPPDPPALDGDSVMPLGAGTTNVTSGDPAWVAGQAGLVFSAPGAGNTGFVNIEADLAAAVMTWLQYDWDGDGVHDNDPTGRASFGVYEGPSQIIYEREPAPF